MASTVDGWRDARATDHGVRLAIAFAVSLVCHVACLVVLRGWQSESRPIPPLMVTMLVGGGAGGGDTTGGGPLVPAALDGPPPPAPVVAAAAEPVVPKSVVPRPLRAPTVAPRAKPAAPASARDSAPAVSAAANVIGAEATGSGEGATASGGVGSVLARAGGTASGTNGGTGGGADGLRGLCASCPTPEYPGRARRQGWQGTVDVALAIARDGAVAEARVARSSGYPVLDEVALDVARRSRFAVSADGGGLRGELRYRFVLEAGR